MDKDELLQRALEALDCLRGHLAGALEATTIDEVKSDVRFARNDLAGATEDVAAALRAPAAGPGVDREGLLMLIRECLLHHEGDDGITDESLDDIADDYLPDFLALLAPDGRNPAKMMRDAGYQRRSKPLSSDE